MAEDLHEIDSAASMITIQGAQYPEYLEKRTSPPGNRSVEQLAEEQSETLLGLTLRTSVGQKVI
jgi:hypothetical protein